MGGTEPDPPPRHENPILPQATIRVRKPPLSKEPDYSRMCPKCSSILKPAVVPAGHNISLLQCPLCYTTPLCKHCLYPCPDGTCTNQSCQVVSLLLTCDRVTDYESSVYGCALFRACPKCHTLMMHESGCNWVTCPQCRYSFCFICLRGTQEFNYHSSRTCSAQKAPRQRFQT
ncbi:potential E3 ubiquitin-protein ligase ariadne-2 isoform X2 [Silurus meridionalis]|uniref:potential E3 ubiquitin-protein ligase ariadne-2 isoform X2 n=1 Tax=Silurus meridionalis TaxID=175797 RepID=UPI001EEA9311|nr:potential E3 ubiquitin-protein ligase ariadne-2 isoform X2 [Silurus meridionalis]